MCLLEVSLEVSVQQVKILAFKLEYRKQTHNQEPSFLSGVSRHFNKNEDVPHSISCSHNVLVFKRDRNVSSSKEY